MPLLNFTDEAHKRRALQASGYDPTQFDVDANTGNIFKRQVSPTPISPPVNPTTDTPSTSVNQTPTQSQGYSPLQSTGIGAASGVLPAAGGFGAMVAAQPAILPLAGASVAIGPWGPPITEVGLSLLAGLGGGAIVNKLQDAILPSSVKQEIAAASQQNPKSFIAGNVASQLPFMGPSLRNVGLAAKTLGNSTLNALPGRAANIPNSAAEIANLKNVALSGGIPAGLSVVEDISNDQPVSIPKALAMGAGGAVLNKPTYVGQKLLRLSPAPEVPKSFGTAGDIRAKQLENTTLPPNETLKQYNQRSEADAFQAAQKAEKEAAAQGIREQAEESRAIQRATVRAKGDEAIAAMGDAGPKVLPEKITLTPAELEADRLAAPTRIINAENATKAGVENRANVRAAGDEMKGTQQTVEAKAKVSPEQAKANRESNYQLYKQLLSKGDIAGSEKFVKELGEGYYFKRRYLVEKSNANTPQDFDSYTPEQQTAEQQQVLAERRKNFQDETQGIKAPATELDAATRLKAEAEEAGNTNKIRTTKSFFDKFSEFFGGARGVDTKLNADLSAKGQIDAIRDGLKNRLAEVNPNTATPDTLPHEFIHSWYEDLKASNNPYERLTAKNLERALLENPEFQSEYQKAIANRRKPLDVDEFIAEVGGYEVFKRAVNLDELNGTTRRAWRDFVSRVKLKWGKNLSVSDVQNFIAKRFLNDPPISESVNNNVANTQQSNEKGNNDASKTSNSEIRETNRQGEDQGITSGGEQEKPQGSEKLQQRVSDGNRGGQDDGGAVKASTPSKPEIARLNPTSKMRNSFGDPMGTSYRASKEDYEAYTKVQSDLKGLKEKGLSLASDEGQALFRENERIKNLYGGMPPESPKLNQPEGQGLDIENSEGFKNYTKNKTIANKKNGLVLKRNLNDPFDDIILISKDPKNNEKWRATMFSREDVGEPLAPVGHRDFNDFDTAFKSASGVEFADDDYAFGSSAFKVDNDKLFQKGEESGIQGDDDNAPKDIVGRINETISSPAFNKESSIKRGARELFNRSSSARLPIVGSDLEKLRIRTGESGRQIAPAIGEALAKADALEGEFLNPSVKDWNGLSKSQQGELYNTFLNEVKGDKNLRDTIKDEDMLVVYDAERARLVAKQNQQIKANQPVDEYIPNPDKEGSFHLVKRLPKVNPNYFPQITGSKQLDILLNYEGSAAFNVLKSDFIQHVKEQYKLSSEDAAEMFEDVKASYGGPLPGNSTRFGAVRRAEGIGLPESWIEPNGVTAMRRYWRRVAKDRSWYDAVESDHNNLYVLGQSKDAWGESVKPTKERLSKLAGNETLKGILDTIQGSNIKQHPVIDASSRIANNLILGPLTGASDFVSALPIISKFALRIGDLPRIYTEAVKNIATGIANAKKTGRIKEKTSDIEDLWYASTENVEKLRNIADGISKVTGRQKLEEFSRGLSQAAGESIIKIQKGLAESGDEKAITFLEKLSGPSKDYSKLSDIELASRIVDMTQGTYDVRGLPSWILNSQVAPFFRLMKWNVEQVNSLHKNVIIPATNGNFAPLITTLGGGILGGYLVKEMREKLGGKRTQIPGIKEILAAKGDAGDKIHAATYSVAAALSYSGVLGLFGEIFKTAADASFKNKPQGLNYPLVELLTDATDNTADAIQAIVQDGENPLVVLPEYFKNLFADNVQVAKIINNHLLTSKEDRQRTQGRRDLRVFKQVSGLPVASQTATEGANKYSGLESKDFQRSTDLKELAPEASRLIKRAVVRAKGNPDILRNELRKLKSGSDTSFPSPEANPKLFSDYLNYLKELEGDENARKRLSTYGRNRGINAAKRSLIPSL